MTANQQQIKLELSPVPSVKSTEKANIILIRNPKLLKTLDQDDKPILFQLRPTPIQTKTATQTNNAIPALSSLNGVFNHKTLASLILNASNNCLDSRDASWLLKSICNKNSIAVINDSILKTSLVAQPHLMRNLTLTVDKQSTVGGNEKKENGNATGFESDGISIRLAKSNLPQATTITATTANPCISIISNNSIGNTKNVSQHIRNNLKNNQNNIKINGNKNGGGFNNSNNINAGNGENSNNNNSDTKNFNESKINNTIINNIDINKTNNNENNTKSKNNKSNNNTDKRSDKVIKPHTSTRTIEATNMVPSIKYSSSIPLSAGEYFCF